MYFKLYGINYQLIYLLLTTTLLQAQKPHSRLLDSNYIKSYDTTITSRVFLSQKYISLRIKDPDTLLALKYRPNSKLAIGIGGTYGWLNLNISAAIPLLNLGDKNKGKTRAYDLQAHLYGPKFTIDLLAQFYKGFYLYPPGTATENLWYLRPDMAFTQFGLSGFYALNWRQFSYRAAYLQNAWQVKSAGSFLIGAEVYYGRAKADSAFIPTVLENSYLSKNIDFIRFGDFGPAAGYAYTLVIAKHYFISAAATGTLSANWLREKAPGVNQSKFNLNPNYTLKGAIGYNSRRFTASATWVNNSVVAGGKAATYTFLAGNVRLHAAWRLQAGKSLKKTLKMFQKPLFMSN